MSGDQPHRKNIEKYWKYSRLNFEWNLVNGIAQCNECSFNCKSVSRARNHKKSHKRLEEFGITI